MVNTLVKAMNADSESKKEFDSDHFDDHHSPKGLGVKRQGNYETMEFVNYLKYLRVKDEAVYPEATRNTLNKLATITNSKIGIYSNRTTDFNLIMNSVNATGTSSIHILQVNGNHFDLLVPANSEGGKRNHKTRRQKPRSNPRRSTIHRRY